MGKLRNISEQYDAAAAAAAADDDDDNVPEEEEPVEKFLSLRLLVLLFHLQCYNHKVPADTSFGLLLVFHVKLGVLTEDRTEPLQKIAIWARV